MKTILTFLSTTLLASAATFFNGKDLSGWSAAEMKYWSVKDGVIVGNASANVPKNEFLWSDVKVKDFYLVVDVKLSPPNRNAGIQFRSKPINEHGQALGYQADVGAGVWGKLYHEHGRKKLDWNNHADKAVRHGEWNRYEILAVGHQIWTAINDTLCVAIEDPEGELSGKIALQIHSGPPQRVEYRIVKFVHNPPLKLAKHSRADLLAALPKKQAAEATVDRSVWNDEVRTWRALLDANDPGMNAKWFARGHDDSQWKTMRLPAIFERAGLSGHDGTVWFRRTVRLTAAQAQQEQTLNLGPIDDMDMAWVNGTQVGGIEIPGYWLKPRSYPVPAKLLRPGQNVITVRVIDHGWSGGFTASPKQMKLNAHNLDGPWRYHAGVSLKSLGLKNLTNPTNPQPTKTAAPAKPAIEVPAVLLPLARPSRPVPGFEDGFAIDRPQTIAIFGGSNAAECQRHGWLELRLISAFPKHRVRLRNLAWPTDTVFQQTRPRNFFGQSKPDYGEKDGREQISIDVAVLWFGQMESLQGEQGIDDFTKAYEQLIEQVSAYTKRIILVSPAPFDDPLSLGFDLKKRNGNLQRYADAIRRLADQHRLPLVKLPPSSTRDGTALSEAGHKQVAKAFARQLGFARKLPPFTNYLRDTIREKNVIWSRYWLPSNWAFLYGNRQTQPSSRDHRDKSKRWFPKELEEFQKRAEELEQQIHTRVRENR
ncbi:MAG: family 16 glycoside hydrolase [Limisphaerales bacterium]